MIFLRTDDGAEKGALRLFLRDDAPHTSEFLLSDRLPKVYPAKYAAYPLPFVQERGKFWPPVRRINDLYGDKSPNVLAYNNQNFYESSEKILQKNLEVGLKNIESLK